MISVYLDFSSMRAEETSTTSSDPTYYEGIASQNIRSGMPAGYSDLDTSGNVTGYNTLHISQFQR